MEEIMLFCEKCGTLIKKDHNNECCGLTMKELKANTTDAATEKHIPVIDINNNEVTIIVGEILHPMSEEHYITDIYLETNEGIKQKRLTPNDEPKVIFVINEEEEVIGAYAYCNLHSLWKKDYKEKDKDNK